jgi:predicted nucleic acid-binding Zn ribbon protein
MGKSVFQPEYHCPICGKKVGKDAHKWASHRCAERTYRGIDGSSKRENLHYSLIQPVFSVRLREGFRLLRKFDTSFGWDED